MKKILLWLASLCVVLFVLVHYLAASYPIPTTISTTNLPLAVFGIVRALCIAATGYLLVTSLLILATAGRHSMITRIIQRIALPSLNDFIVRVSGVGVAGVLLLQTQPASATGNREVPVLRHLLPDEAAPMTTMTTTTTVVLPAAPIEVVPTPQLVNDYVVRRGENLWVIAHDHWVTKSGREPSERELTDYWHRLVDANRSRLSNPANPDLVFAGQTLELPGL